MSKSTNQRLRRVIEQCELSHAEFSQHYEDLKRRIDDALEGHPATSEWLIGPSRVGKTMLINNLARGYPEEKVDGVRRIPVLVVPVPSPVSPKEMPKSVLAALGMPSVRGNSGDLFAKMERLLKLAGTKVILFEEAKALQERVVGATYHSTMDRTSFLAAPRGMQIWGDVYRRQPLDWLAIDDDALHWPSWCRDKLVRTDGREGIGAPEVVQEIRRGLARLDSTGAADTPR